jgi:hypothetical protein
MSIGISKGAVCLRSALLAVVFGGFAAGIICGAQAADPPKPEISADATTAVAQMGKTLEAQEFSFRARTLRVYATVEGQHLHIAHTMDVVVRRPDRLRVDVNGDDGAEQFLYDGTTTFIYGPETKKYMKIPSPNTIQDMLEAVSGRLGVDFPLADFIATAPDKAFLFGVTAGREVNTVTINDVPCRHLLFNQPGVQIELWLEKNDRALPRRVIATYTELPDRPVFVAEMSDWKFDVHPADAQFTFQPPQGAEQVAVKASERGASDKKE